MSYPITSANRPKAVAKKLRAHLAARGRPMSLGASLDLVSRAYGHHDWNALSASIPSASDALPIPGSVEVARRHAASVLAKAGLDEPMSVIEGTGMFGLGTEDGSARSLDMRVYRELAKVPFLKAPLHEDLGPTLAHLSARRHDLWEFAALLRGGALDALAAVDQESLHHGMYKRGWGFLDVVWHERMDRICQGACRDSLVMTMEPALFADLDMNWSTIASRDRGLVESIEALKAAHDAGGTMAHAIAFIEHPTGFGLRQEAFPGSTEEYLVQAGEADTQSLRCRTGLGRMLAGAAHDRSLGGRRRIEALNQALIRLFAFGDDVSYAFNCVVARMLGFDHLVQVTDTKAKASCWAPVAHLVPTSAARGRVGGRERFLDVHGVHSPGTLPAHLGLAPDEILLERIPLDPVEDEGFDDNEPASFLRAVALCLPWIERLSPVESRHPANVDRVVLLEGLMRVYVPGSTRHGMGLGDQAAWDRFVRRAIDEATIAQVA